VEPLVVGLLASAQLVIAAWILLSAELSPSRRVLAASLSFGVPLLGPGLAYVSCTVRGRGTPRLDMDDEDSLGPRHASVEAMRRNAGRGPMVDRLLGGVGERRAALATAAKRGDRDSVAALRWIIEHGEGEPAVEAAITLEELTYRIETTAQSAVERARTEPTYENLAAAAHAVSQHVQSGLADTTLVGSLADQGAELFAAAVAADPDRKNELLEPWARLELGAIRPQAALELLRELPEDLDDETRETLKELRQDAVFGARRFEIL
jgi:hypothetical protein